MTPGRFRIWDNQQQVMSPVATISFGDDGSALTVVFESAPRSELYNPLVVGESGILMQSTGLTDKNGVEIFEGDVIELKAGYETGRDYRLQVVWDTKRSRFSVSGEVGSGGSHRDLDHWVNSPWCKPRCEVIGNGYANPELLPQAA